MSRRDRVQVANLFLAVIASHGREFFKHGDRIARFELDDRGRVWFVDAYSGRRIYTHRRVWGRGFTNGGTLMSLCQDLQRYVMGRGPLPLARLGPWRKDLCGGDLWGYGADMEKVRAECSVLEP